MKIKIVLLFAVAITAAQVSQPTLAVPTTYDYTGNPFTEVNGVLYTTSDKVTGSVTLASPLMANMPTTTVTPLAFSFSDGVQTLTNTTSGLVTDFAFATDATGAITLWRAFIQTGGTTPSITSLNNGISKLDTGALSAFENGLTTDPGVWTVRSVPDAGSTFALLSLSFTALGVASRQSRRAVA